MHTFHVYAHVCVCRQSISKNIHIYKRQYSLILLGNLNLEYAWNSFMDSFIPICSRFFSYCLFWFPAWKKLGRVMLKFEGRTFQWWTPRNISWNSSDVFRVVVSNIFSNLSSQNFGVFMIQFDLRIFCFRWVARTPPNEFQNSAWPWGFAAPRWDWWGASTRVAGGERFERSGDAWRIIPGLAVVVNNQWRVYISPQGPWGYSISKWPNFMAEINGGVISDPNYLTTWGWSSKWWVDDGLPLWC